MKFGKLGYAIALLALLGACSAPAPRTTLSPTAESLPTQSSKPTSTHVAIATISHTPTLSVAFTPTATRELSRTKTYNPAEWEYIYDKGTVQAVVADSQDRIWIVVLGELKYFDGQTWHEFWRKDLGGGVKGYPFMAVASDDSLWAVMGNTLLHYQEGRWEYFIPPDSENMVFEAIAIDPSGAVWIAAPDCECEDSVRKFDGTDWSGVLVPNTDWEVRQLLFTDDGNLWAELHFQDVLARYDGQDWKLYKNTDFSLEAGDIDSIGYLARDKDGNLVRLYGGVGWSIIRRDHNGDFSTIPIKAYSPSREFDVPVFDIFWAGVQMYVDQQDTIWINGALDNNEVNLAFYQDGEWTYFVNMPLGLVHCLNGLSDGTLLVGASFGLYAYKPNE